jgi:putative transcriptional regulator
MQMSKLKEKMKTKKHASPILASVHETATGLHEARVMDKQTMRKFDAMCLTPRDSLLVLDLLENPPAPNAKLRAAIASMPKPKRKRG